MRWRFLVPLLALVLLGALVFSGWPAGEAPPSSVEAAPAVPSPAPAPPARVSPPPAVAAPLQHGAPTTPRPAPPTAPSPQGGSRPAPAAEEASPANAQLEPGPGPGDAGVLHALTRDGIKSAIQGELPEIRECYQAWLRQDPELGGSLKVQFTIVEVPGKPQGQVTTVQTVDGGIGHLAFEGCVKNVFAGLRFERPEGGEMKVTYPLTFENRAETP